ncbi:MAG: IclR family transcriptional regulator [Fretibacterium sp.]|nr:IclR family transcriptional regulator [Fretibacterium sp.]
MNPSRYLNRSILRALQTLECFAQPHPTLSIPEIAKEIGLHRSTVHRLVVTLESVGWLRKIPDTEKYTLGIKVAILGQFAQDEMSSCQILRPLLNDLAVETGETAILSMFDGNSVLCVDKIESSQKLKISSEIGQSFPFYAGGTGFAVLLGMPEDEVQSLLFRQPLAAFTEKTETNPEKVLERYRTLKQAGYVVSTGAVDPGITGVAAPLFFFKENMYGSVGITMPEHRAEGEGFQRIVQKVLSTAEAMSKMIGGIQRGEHK